MDVNFNEYLKLTFINRHFILSEGKNTKNLVFGSDKTTGQVSRNF